MKKLNWKDFLELVSRGNVMCVYPGTCGLVEDETNVLTLLNCDEEVPTAKFEEQTVLITQKGSWVLFRLKDTRGRNRLLNLIYYKQVTLADVPKEHSLVQARCGKQLAWNVLNESGTVIDTVYYDNDMTAEDVKRSLVDHDGYDEAITIEPNGYLEDTDE